MRKDYDNELKAMGRLGIFALCVAFLGIFSLTLRGCVISRSHLPQAAPGAPLASGFDQFAGQVVLVEFAESPTGYETGDSMLLNEWAAQDALLGLKYARVLTSVKADAKAAKNFTLVGDPAGRLAASCKVKSRPWYVLLDGNGRVRYSSGSLSAEMMDQWVTAILGESASPSDNVPIFGAEPDGAALRESTVLKTLKTGEEVRLSSLVGRSGTVLLTVDTVCPYCEQAVNEFPQLSSMLERLGFYTAIVNINDERPDVLSYYAKHAVGQNVFYDESPMTKLAWNIETIPTVIVMDTTGKIHYSSAALWQDVINAAAAASRSSAAQYEVKVRGTGYG